MKSILSNITVTAFILVGLSTAISATDIVASSAIPDELIARQLTTHDPSLAITVEAVFYKLKRNRPLTLVDVRRQQEFERLRIPGSLNIPLYAVKTKTYLKPKQIVLVNEGFSYFEMQAECRQLAERGYTISILDGGLPAWKRHGGQLVGDLFALDAMKTVLPQEFFRAKNYENTVVIDISPKPGTASSRLMPFAKHISVTGSLGTLKSELRTLLKNKKPFQSIIVVNEFGEHYDKAQKMLNRLGVNSYYLQGGVAGYQNYLEGLMLSWKPRDRRMKTVGNCKPCGEKEKE